MAAKAFLFTFLHGERIGNAKPPFLLRFRSSNGFIIATVALAVFTDIFLYSVVVPILPFALNSRAGVETADTQRWSAIFLSVYGAALGVGSLLFGYFADKSTSRRMPLLLGLLALGGATAMLCAGTGLPMLLMGRIFQGLSAAVVWTVGLALLSDTVDKDGIGQAMGYISASCSIASVAGPLLGGVVYERAGYYAVFAMCFSIIGLDIILRLIMIEKKTGLQWVPVSASGQPSSPQQAFTGEGPSAEIVTSEEIKHNQSGQSEKQTFEPHSRIIQRLPPIITLLRIPRLLAALFGCFIHSISLASFESVLPLFVKETFHWSSIGAGLIFTCLMVPAFFAPMVGHMSDRYGSRVITTIGLLGAVPCWVLLRLVTNDSINHKVLLCALLTLIGSCQTLIASPLMADLDHTLTVEERRRPGSLGKRGAAAQGFGLFNFAFACGSLIGPLWAGFVRENAGWGTMAWSLGLLSGIGAIITFIWTGGRIMLRGQRREVAEV